MISPGPSGLLQGPRLALIVVAVVYVTCQPFSVAGKMLGGDDPRAWDTLLVCEAAVALGAVHVLLGMFQGIRGQR